MTAGSGAVEAVLAAALEADFGCGVGEVDVEHGPICASSVHIGALYGLDGCTFAANVAAMVHKHLAAAGLLASPVGADAQEFTAVRNAHLARAKSVADWDAGQGPATSHSPDDRTVGFLLAGILDALVAIAETQDRRMTAPPESTLAAEERLCDAFLGDGESCCEAAADPALDFTAKGLGYSQAWRACTPEHRIRLGVQLFLAGNWTLPPDLLPAILAATPTAAHVEADGIDVEHEAERLWNDDSHPAMADEREWPEVDGLMRLSYIGRAADVMLIGRDWRAVQAARVAQLGSALAAAEARLGAVEALADRLDGEPHGCLSPEQHGYGCHQCWRDEIRSALATAADPVGPSTEAAADGLLDVVEGAVARFELHSDGDLGAATIRLHGDLLAVLARRAHPTEAAAAPEGGVYAEVAAERARAHAKHGDTSMESYPPDDPTGKRYRILAEEVGEVAKEWNDAEHDGRPVDLAAVRKELIQVAAMAAAWADAINQPVPDDTTATEGESS